MPSLLLFIHRVVKRGWSWRGLAPASAALGLAIGSVGVAFAAGPSVKTALELRPVQKGVPFQEVAADEADKCRVEDLKETSYCNTYLQYDVCWNLVKLLRVY